MRLRLLKGGARPQAVPETPRAGDDLAPIAQAARGGAPDAVRTLVSAIGPAILRTIRRVLGAHHPDVEDLAQDSALAFVAALGGFRGECSTLHFACRIAVLTTLKHRRAEAARVLAAREKVALEELLDTDVAGAPLAALVAARRRTLLRELLDDLPEPQAEALLMQLLLGYSIEEIGAVVGAPGNTVRSRVRLGKEALRARIEADGRLAELLFREEEPLP